MNTRDGTVEAREVLARAEAQRPGSVSADFRVRPPDTTALARAWLDACHLLDLYRAKRAVDGLGMREGRANAWPPARCWEAGTHLLADRAIERIERGITIAGPMDNVAAFAEAVRRWGPGACIVGGWAAGDEHRVGLHAPDWASIIETTHGTGATWEEAFAAADAKEKA